MLLPFYGMVLVGLHFYWMHTAAIKQTAAVNCRFLSGGTSDKIVASITPTHTCPRRAWRQSTSRCQHVNIHSSVVTGFLTSVWIQCQEIQHGVVSVTRDSSMWRAHKKERLRRKMVRLGGTHFLTKPHLVISSRYLPLWAGEWLSGFL